MQTIRKFLRPSKARSAAGARAVREAGQATREAEQRAQHTPGPWQFKTSDGSPFEFGNSVGDIVLRIRGGMTPRTVDARLIAAAPDLLAALEAIVSQIDPEKTEIGLGNYLNARAAIAKAKGEA